MFKYTRILYIADDEFGFNFFFFNNLSWVYYNYIPNNTNNLYYI